MIERSVRSATFGVRSAHLVLATLALLLYALPGSAQVQVAPPCTPLAAGGSIETELVLLVDSSGSISSEDWTLEKEALTALIDDQTLFPRNSSVAVAVMQYSTGFDGDGDRVPLTETEVCLTPIRNEVDAYVIKLAIRRMNQIGFGTAEGGAIQAATELIVNNGDSTTEQRSICVLTDGVANAGPSAFEAALQAEAAGIDRLSVSAFQDVGKFEQEHAEANFLGAVYGGGQLTFAGSNAEFVALLGSSCMAKPVRLHAFEVNQSVQDWEGLVPLVEHKPTIARVFLEPEACPADPRLVTTTARLVARRGGTELTGLVLPTNELITASFDCTPADDRGNPVSSLNFRLPEEWLSGDVELELALPGGIDCGDGQIRETCTKAISFGSADFPAMTLLSLPTRLSFDPRDPTVPRPIRTPSIADLVEQEARLMAALPVAEVKADLEIFASTVAEGSEWRLDPKDNRWKEDRLDSKVLDEIKWYFWKTKCTLGGGCPTDRVHGLAFNRGGVVGVSNPDGWRISHSNIGFGEAQRFGAGHYRNTASHELAHNFQVSHTTNGSMFGTKDGDPLGPCGSQASASKDPSWPLLYTDPANTTDRYNGRRAVMGPLASPRVPAQEIWGVATNIFYFEDHPLLAIPDPTLDWALMSYCPRTLMRTGQLFWPSSINYMNVLGVLQTTQFDAPIGVGLVDEDILYVFSGKIEPDTDAVELAPVWAVPGPGLFEAAPGDYTVELLDGSGAVLEATSFAPVLAEPNRPADPESQAEPDAQPSFFVTLPAPTEPVAEIVIRHGASELLREAASANAPAVQITEPAPAATFDAERVRFAWTATDDDGDSLRHAVDYSADGGTTWVPLAVGLDVPELELERQWLRAGTAAQMRVTSTDGLRSTTAVSEFFSVGNNGPSVVVQSPADGQRFSSAQRIALRATAHDREDGRLDGESVEWISSRDGSLGFGAKIDVGAETLSEGTHFIVARALDSQSEPGGETVSIEVSRVPPTNVVVPDFSLRLDPPARSINPGATATFQVLVTALNGFEDPVDLIAIDLPEGWTADFDATRVTPDASVELEITAPDTALEDGIPVIVQGESGDLLHTTAGTADLVFGLIPQCYGQFSGRVRDAYTGLPIEGATATPPSWGGITDVAGFFLSGDVVPRDDLVLDVAAQGYYKQRLTKQVVRCDDVTHIEVELVPVLTGTLFGKVVKGTPDPADTSAGRSVTPTNTPIGGATVRASVFTQTAGDGGYTLTGVPLKAPDNAPQTYSFTASAPNHWDQRKVVTVSETPPVELDFELVEKCEFILEGGGQAVWKSGLPAEGARIHWTTSFSGFGESATSGPDGRFQMPRVSALPGNNNSSIEVGLSVQPPLTGAPIPPSVTVEFPQTVDQCGENVLEPFLVIIDEPFVPPVNNYARLQGVMRDELTGDPVPKVSFYIHKVGGTSISALERADANGAFDVEVLVGTGDDVSELVYVHARRTDTHWGNDSPDLEITAGADNRQDVEVPPIDFMTVEGVLRDRETGAPLAGYKVTGRGLDPESAFSDANGFFSIQGIMPNDQNEARFISLEFPQQFAPGDTSIRYYAEQEVFFGEPGETYVQDLFPLRRCAGAAISGVVVNAATLDPLEDARVAIFSSSIHDMTDVDGRFRLDGIIPATGNQPRQVEVLASKTGFVTATKVVTIFCGAEIFLEFGTPSAGFGEIFGTVTDATTGDPIEGVFVGSGYGQSATTDALGQYTLQNAPLAADGSPRIWRVTSTRDLDSQSADVTVQAGTPTQQDFQFEGAPVFGIDVGDERTGLDPLTRVLTSRSTLTVTNTTSSAVTGPVAATILIDRVGVDMPEADGVDADGHPVVIVVEPGVELAAGESASVQLLFARPAPQPFLYDVQITLGDPSVVESPLLLQALAVFPPESDTDGDRWHDSLDVCPASPDPLQDDADGDGFGDACDLSEPGADTIAPSAWAESIELSGLAPEGTVVVTLGSTSVPVDETRRFTITAALAAESSEVELVFTDAAGGIATHRVSVSTRPVEAEAL